MKRSIDDLAVFGGPVEFDEPLHVGRPNLGDRDALMARIEGVLDRNWLTNDGPLVREFEARVAGLIGVRHCMAMCNGTVALEIAIRSAGLTGEVIVPAFTFVATAHALQWQEITPVFCDIDPVTHTMDPARVEALITPRTTGILAVHLWGQPCHVDRLSEIAERNGLTLLFDAAHAFGSASGDTMVGNFGTAEVLSFHATKFLNSFEGGAIVTNDDDFAERCRLMRNFGFVDYDNVDYVGTNGKMTEVAAAMGLTSLEAMDAFLEVNRANHERYADALDGIPGVRMLRFAPDETRNRQYVVLEIDEAVTGVSRDALYSILWSENVRARRYFYPGVHRMQPYAAFFPHAGLLLPETERLVQQVMTLPTGTAIGADEIARVTSIIRVALCGGTDVAARLPAVSGAASG
jgi:dTDP-4-amino-4,6-dideoxygalactose transaminase